MRALSKPSTRLFSTYNGIYSAKVQKTIDDFRALTKPDNVHVCDGSEEEQKWLVESLLKSGTIEPIPKRPGSYLARSDPKDVARVEKQTYICSEREVDAGPTNNWVAPAEMKQTLNGLFDGSMQGRTMYVVPFSMGHVGGPLSKLGLQMTDSAYVALSMRTMARMGKESLDLIQKQDMEDVIPCYHTVGAPNSDAAWPCNETKYIVHYPEEPSIWSYGSGYGGNALLGKKCLALRIASSLGKREGWLAEHMVIMSVTLEATGEKRYICAAFPSACGKTNLAMLNPSIPGVKVETVGDDIAWLKWGEDGRLWAINPENGFFGVAPGTSQDTNPKAMDTIETNTIFTNVAKTDDGDVWWEGMTKDKPAKLTDWKGRDWTPESDEPAAHPNSRFCVNIEQCPSVDHEGFASQKGVPIDAILFGGRRASTIPLVTEALNFEHGVFMGASVASEQTAAAEGPQGELRHDPFAMLPFCGYNMGDYFQHWLDMGSDKSKQLPKIFSVNWFRKDDDGKFMWPGFGDNARVLKWIVQRLGDSDNKMAKETPIGYVPSEGSLDTEGLSEVDMKALFDFDKQGWKRDLSEIRSYFGQFGDQMPKELLQQIDRIEKHM